MIRTAVARLAVTWHMLAPEHRRLVLWSVLGLCALAELVWIWPQRTLRQQLDTGQAAQAQALAQERHDQQAQLHVQVAQLRRRLSELDARAPGLAAAQQRAVPLGDWLARVQQALAPTHTAPTSGRADPPSGLQVLALRDLGTQVVQPDGQQLSAAGAEDDAAPDQAHTAPELVKPVTLYRHRYELHLSGPLPVLLQAADRLIPPLQPLRLVHTALVPGSGPHPELRLRWQVLSPSPTWMVL